MYDSFGVWGGLQLVEQGIASETLRFDKTFNSSGYSELYLDIYLENIYQLSPLLDFSRFLLQRLRVEKN